MLPNSQLEKTLNLQDVLDFFDVFIKPDKKINPDLFNLIKSVGKEILAFLISFEQSDSPKQFSGLTYKFKILIAKNIFPNKEFARDLLNDIITGGKQFRSLLADEEVADKLEMLKFMNTPVTSAISVRGKFPILRSGISMFDRNNIQHLEQFNLSPATLRSAQEEITENFIIANRLRGQAIEAYHVARAYHERHDFIAAIQYYDTAIKLFTNIKEEFAHPDDLESLAECHSCVSWALVKKATLEYFGSDLKRAMLSLKTAHQHMQAVPAKFKNAYDEQTTKIGTLLAKLCEYDDLIRTLEDNSLTLTVKYRRLKASALMEIGDIYYRCKQFKIVSSYYTPALDQLHQIPKALFLVQDHTLRAALYTNLLVSKIRLANEHFAADHYLDAVRYAQEVLILFRIVEGISPDHLDKDFASRMVITKANVKRDIAVSLYEQALMCLETNDFEAVKQHLRSAIKILNSLPVRISNSQDAAHLKLYQDELDKLNLQIQQHNELDAGTKP